MRPLSMRKSVLSRIWRRVIHDSGLKNVSKTGELFSCCISSAEHRIVARSPTSSATRTVVLHKALDGAQAALVALAELLGEHGLDFEGEQFLGAAGVEMKEAAHRPEEVLATAEGRRPLPW